MLINSLNNTGKSWRRSRGKYTDKVPIQSQQKHKINLFLANALLLCPWKTSKKTEVF